MRRQLAVLVASTTSVVVIAFLVPLALLVRELAEDRAVSAATQEAQYAAVLVGFLGPGQTLNQTVGALNEQSPWRTTIFLDRGRSVGVPTRRTTGVRAAFEGGSLTAESAAGSEVLQPVETASGPAVVRTFIPADELRSGVTRAWLVLAALGVGLIAVALVVADRLARRIARPLGDLADATRQLGEGRLDVRVHADGPPEVIELGTVVNRLAGRIQALLAAERELVADLSHRLRTPITALRLDSESLRDSSEAERLGAGVDGLERAVDDVIRHARRPAEVQRVDAAEVVAERVAFWAALADDQGRPVHLDLPSVPVLVRLAASDLAAAVDALLENALSHTPAGTAVHVRLRTEAAGGGVLVVEDEGPGLPDVDALARGSSAGGSTGLGLDIARRTAAASGGSLELGRGEAGGASVRMLLGPPGGSEPAPATESTSR